MGIKKNKTIWYPLDNAAKIYPPTASERRPHVFSFSTILTCDVSGNVLRQAVEKVTNCNPTFKTKLMRGKFWYYLEENMAEIKVFNEDPYYLRSIDYKENNNYLFKVLFTKNRITINFFHALTDGTGGFNFFSQVLLEYFNLMNYDIDSEGKIRTVDSPSFFDDSDDSFLIYDKSSSRDNSVKKKPYKLRGTSFSYDGCGIITAKAPISKLKELAKSHNATITAFLGGLYLYNIYKAQLFSKPVSNKRLSLLVPCNLRKRYGGSTMRNFSMYARISHDFSDREYSLNDFIEISQKQISEQLTTDNLDKIIHSNVKTEKNPIIKIVPLALKDVIMRIAYKKVGENLQTAIFSNLGLVNLPDSFSKYVKHLTFSITPTFSCRQQMTAIGYNDSLYVTFTRDFVENNIEKNFFRMLSEMGVELKLFSNYWESEL